MKKRMLREETIAFSILFIMTLFFFFRIIFLRYYFFEDFLYQYYPRRNLLATSLRIGVFPLWNPFVFGGMPYLGDIENAVFYPFNWLLALFTSGGRLVFRVLEIQLILHVFFAGIFMYMFLRRLGISHEGSIISSIGFAFSGFIITHTIHLTLLSTFVYLPLVLYFLLRSFQERRVIYSLFGGFFLGLSLLAGGPQFWLHIVYYAGLFSVFLLVEKKKQWVKYVHLPVILFISGILVSSVQLLTTAGYTAYTVRESLTYAESVRNSIPFYQLLTLFIPKFFGYISWLHGDNVKFWTGGYGAFWETCIYLGIIPLILSLYAFTKKDRRKYTIFFGILALLFLMAAMGKYTPVYWIFYHLLPGFNKFRNAGRFSGVFTFSLLALAGFGFDNLSKGKVSLKPLLYFTGSLFLLFVFIFAGAFRNAWSAMTYQKVYSYSLKQTGIALLFLILSSTAIFVFMRYKNRYAYLIPALVLFIDLFSFGANFNVSRVNPDEFYSENRLVEYLKEDYKKEPFRVNARQGSYMLLRRNSGDIYKLELLQGYTPLRLKLYRELRQLPLNTYLDLFNAKYTIRVEERRMGLVLNQTYLPRAKVFYRWEYVDGETAYKKLKEGYDYHNVLLIGIKEDFPQPETTGTQRIEYTERGINRIGITVDTDRNGVLFVSLLNIPGWKAVVNGVEKKILPVDYAFAGIYLEKGRSNVLLFYSPPGLRTGLILTLLTLVFMIFYGVLDWFRRKNLTIKKKSI
ncbi:hypothetical protein DRQ17_00090 [bacterium]|nr:MAG: hypothetical protein DRQ17_00090 [bacterium]